MIALQSDCYALPGVASPLKLFVGRGNNSRLIKETFKGRWWWSLTEEVEEA
jgi:hypothetical protein